MRSSPIGGGSGSSLRPADRGEFEDVVDEALRTKPLRSALADAAPGTAEALRARARESADELTALVAEEYREWCRLRDGGPSDGGTPRRSPLFAAVAVLVPLIAGAAAVVFLVLGYVLLLIDSRQDLGATLVLTGWTGAGLAAVTGALGLGRVVVAARRPSGMTSGGGTRGAGEAGPVAEARRRWRTALRDRAVVPSCQRWLSRNPEGEPGRAPDAEGAPEAGG
ncbi:hypothetical protein [Streptomyces sp. NPDC005438]|uniref:hypothetical protein n=1 Tax=Streptomyces sp. NPDC005438 TaxID=3156880 RepID=UPI0033BE1242